MASRQAGASPAHPQGSDTEAQTTNRERETVMKVSKAIQMLKEIPDQDEEIVLAFWRKELFQDYYEDGSLTDEVWRDVVAGLDSFDLSDYTNESAWCDITERIDERIADGDRA